MGWCRLFKPDGDLFLRQSFITVYRQLKNRKMKRIFNVTVFFSVCFALISCDKYDKDYKNFLGNHEVVYPGLASKLSYQAGNLRTALVWNPSPDPNITKYVISWNNGVDSMIVNATSHDPADVIKVIIANLKEYVYTFKINSFDKKGNKSVALEINNVRVYGSSYQSGLLNRTYNAENPYVINSNGSVKLNFNKADSSNVLTGIKYTNNLGVVEERQLKADSSSITLPNYKIGTLVQYRSSYVPAKSAIDSFYVANYEDFSTIYNIIQCDKSLFQPFYLPTDVGSAYGWELYNLWNNDPEGTGFHTPGVTLPVWFTFDMGVKSALTSFKLWQRSSALYALANPKKFEVWGSNDPNPNGDWANWSKLATCNSFKPSGWPEWQNSAQDIAFAAAGERFIIPGAPEVRYLRFKILETWGGANYFHAMELTFYKRE